MNDSKPEIQLFHQGPEPKRWVGWGWIMLGAILVAWCVHLCGGNGS